MQDALLAMLAKEPAHGYALRARLQTALGPLGAAMNPGQVYVTLSRLEKAGLVVCVDAEGAADRKVYEATAAGRERAARWFAGAAWPKPDLAEFHLKLVAAAASGMADPVELVALQRRELMRRLRDAQRAALEEPGEPVASLLLEGVVLRLEADLRWLETCDRTWRGNRSDREDS
ncbi:transcriptional regulator [Streptomyces bingchenggensis BCW-1]|uniref:Transcriptional regulator n=1 Tax=Streptomyces bingchenggensis (strain BCW-1) TaxID=749414 RepID=D7BVK3_STRBB|nr:MULTISPECIES: PadR family transcriptional regulator [Streptomyces]ADI07604.1 transcriptional regulator [Streptomyces bingchenggensis BCW-1]